MQREDKREYHEAVKEERDREEDGQRRESKVTGGASGSSSPPEEEAEPEETKEETEAEEAHAKARVAKGLGQPREPSAAEVATHRLAHLPYEEWCPICVSSKGQERPHFKSKDEEDDDRLPQFGLDYGFFGEDLKLEEKGSKE